MRNLLLFVGAISLLYSCAPTGSGTSEGTDVQQYSIEQFMNNTSVFGSSVSADGSKLLVTSNESGIFNVYELDLTTKERKPLTASTGASIFAQSYFPNDNRFLYSQDDNGNEIPHLFVQTPEGETTELTPDTSARAVFYGWTHDLQSFYYGYSKRDPRFMDVYKMDIEDFSSTMVYEMSGAENFGGISDDGKYMAIVIPLNSNDADLYIHNLVDQSRTKVNASQSSNSPSDFSKDGKSLYFLTDEGNEFSYLMRYDISTGEKEKIKEADWDISYSYFSYNGKYQVSGINEDGKTVVSVKESATGKEVDFPQFESGSISGVSINRSEDKAIFTVASSSSPSNIYSYDFATGESTKLTDNLNAEINAADLVTASVVRYPSFDDLKIPAIYYKPKQASASNKVPALVWVHGGPGGQSRQSYQPLIQYLVNHGYAVLAVNNRGSSGYGKTFFNMDNRNHGEKDLKDCVWGKEWLAQQDYINPEQIGIIGGSYGGFMTMAALTREPEAFDVGVNIFGVTNWLRTLKSIPPWWESFKDALYDEMGDPNQDSVRLYNISPVFHGDKVTKPVMVLQGAKDPRVLQVESDDMVAAVKANGVPVEYVLFEDEGHGFVKKENQIEAYGKILTFLDKYLKNKPPLKG